MPERRHIEQASSPDPDKPAGFVPIGADAAILWGIWRGLRAFFRKLARRAT